MKSRLLNLLTAVSLVLFAVAVIAGIRSLVVTDYLIHETSGQTDGVHWVAQQQWYLVSGQIQYVRSKEQLPVYINHSLPNSNWRLQQGWTTWAPDAPLQQRYAFGYNQWTWNRQSNLVIYAPGWLPLMLTTILPALWLRRTLRDRRRRRDGRCLRCSYDLRATPDRCPECGTLVPSR